MLASTRGFVRLDAALREGRWESQWAVGSTPPPPWAELAGKTLGILGYGRIGHALARRALAFDMTVCAIRREVARSRADGLALLGGLEALDEVLRRADYLAVTLSLNDATRGLLGARELARRAAVEPDSAARLGPGRSAPIVHKRASAGGAPAPRRPAARTPILLRLGDRRRRVCHDGDRRQRAHCVLAALSADPRRVRLGARRDGGRVLVRRPRVGRAQPLRRPPDGSPRPAGGDRARRRRHGAAVAALSHARVIGAIPLEIFEGRHSGTIFGTLMLAAITGGAAGPWVAGALHDATGSYAPAFSLALAGSVFSALAIWLAAPRRVRAVA